ncbi:MAG: RNA-directed DNA polymerase (Reverse transcriptase) [Parcubacteria group bacterium GW2011_GWA2_47_64]|nr:MAG: RNA-directed DNA polymerase (Reverse transcriptase) [Parcubacteria group bacterium GW2011_GWA2_47_64]KKU96503.1 MAG: RNA-directed DNA polymerase (Reverse transcriptase) [Parcubacteria group bacterium GW2011_GWC2_48_17]
MEHILALHRDLRNRTYTHGPYKHFRITDPKPRDIHKANVRDRLLHHALYRKLYPFFDRTFIADSFSCRLKKGTHSAMNRFRAFAYQASKNHTQTCFALKCDIRKFFANIDHEILFSILSIYIPDTSILMLLKNIVESFTSGKTEAGLPLGNLSSQLLVNIYLNEFDQFVKHRLKVKYYIRYADDFVILSHGKSRLERIVRYIVLFMRERLRLELHQGKVFIHTIASGVDFLGWVHFPNHRVLRTSTKKRMFRRLQEAPSEEVAISYLGLLSHGNGALLQKRIRESYS